MKKDLLKTFGTLIVFELFASYNLKKPNEIFYVPYPKFLRSVEQEKYIKEENDCKHKAIKYHKYLMEHGEKSYVVETWNILKRSEKNHAMVAVKNKGTTKYHLIDPTWNYNIDGGVLERYSNEWIILRQFEENVCINDLLSPKKKMLYVYPKNIKLKKELRKNIKN